MQDAKDRIKKLGLVETEPGSGIYTCRGSPEEFWKNLAKSSREEGKNLKSLRG